MMLSAKQAYCLHQMGIDIWLQRDRLHRAEPRVVDDSADDGADDEAGAFMRELANQVAQCRKCVLHESRTHTVFGVGSENADWLLIGEAPGAEEDRQGKPFVGRAGQLLNAMLQAINLSRDDVFIANILKCRPPKNRDPRPEEVAACAPYLRQQIEAIAPRVILALGRVAAQNLLRVATPIGRMRGQIYQLPDLAIPVVVTYHPAYLLRSPREKRKVWQDLQLALSVYRGS